MSEEVRVLERVPVDDARLERLEKLLTAHGARLEQTDEAPPPSDSKSRTTKMYRVHFPAGTTMTRGEVLLRSHAFVVTFPDGYQLHGAKLWPLDRSVNRYINGLMLPLAA